MDKKEKQNLLYRRQYILCPKNLSCFPSWKELHIDDRYTLYIHPDLTYNEVSKKNIRIIILGDIFDPDNINFSNTDILNQIIKYDHIKEAIESTFKYAGRYAIFYIKDDSVYVFHDPSASRKVFYTVNINDNWCSSQPSIIADKCGLSPTKNIQVLEFYKSKEFIKHRKIDILNNTIYDNIRQLQPNHYLDLKKGIAIRYWPNKTNKIISLKEGVEQGSKLLRAIIESFNKRYDLMMTVTSGHDTRLMLAASRNVSDNIYYYTNKYPNMDLNHPDIRVPSKLLNNLGLKLNILEFNDEVDEDFKEIYFRNNIFALEENLDLIYDTYYKKYSDKFNLPGNFSDIARNFFSTYRKNITPELLAEIWYGSENKYIISQYSTWLNAVKTLSKQYNYNILDLFNWEERNGNWYTKFQIDKDMAQEELIPFNSRQLMSIFLSVNRKYRDIDTNIFYKSMVKYMWPEALTEPMYPKSYTRYYLKKAGLYWIIRRILKKW